jgi:hypothetical protein
MCSQRNSVIGGHQLTVMTDAVSAGGLAMHHSRQQLQCISASSLPQGSQRKHTIVVIESAICGFEHTFFRNPVPNFGYYLSGAHFRTYPKRLRLRIIQERPEASRVHPTFQLTDRRQTCILRGIEAGPPFCQQRGRTR